MSTHNDEIADRLIEEVARLKAAVAAEHQAANLWRERYERANAVLAAAQKRSEYWKAEHLAGNAEIDKLRADLAGEKK